MKLNKKIVLALLGIMLVSTACGNKTTTTNSKEETKATANVSENNTVEITDINGVVSVPLNPEKVVALDNRTFQTLYDWGIKPLALPKDVMAGTNPYKTDDSIENIGNHREPNLEVIAKVDPELVIVGQRFAKYTEQIKEIVPNATVIDLSWDVSKDAENAGENLVNGLKTSTKDLGLIFNKQEEADKLIKDFEDSIEALNKAYNPDQKIVSVVVSGGNIGFSAPKSGRVWGPMYEIFNWTPALDVKESSSDHKGDDVSVEAIAQSNPDWIFVLDRDAATSSAKDSIPAKDVIDGSLALKNVTAIKEGHVVYAPNDTYTNESIQTYITLFNDLADKLSK